MTKAIVIGLVSQKGGVGKSTLAQAIARECSANGSKVKLADLDVMQGTSLDWARRRMAAEIEPQVPVEPFTSVAQATALASQFDVLVLDGPARAGIGTLQIAQAADLVVQPSGTSIADLRPTVLLFLELVRKGVPPERLVVALCRVGSQAEETMAREYLATAGFPVLEGALYERPAYRQAQDDGLAVTETRYATLSKRADELIQALFDRLA